ncbi:unnamed protein product [Discosporangium mesarthrocarpum]
MLKAQSELAVSRLREKASNERNQAVKTLDESGKCKLQEMIIQAKDSARRSNASWVAGKSCELMGVTGGESPGPCSPTIGSSLRIRAKEAAEECLRVGNHLAETLASVAQLRVDRRETLSANLRGVPGLVAEKAIHGAGDSDRLPGQVGSAFLKDIQSPLDPSEAQANETNQTSLGERGIGKGVGRALISSPCRDCMRLFEANLELKKMLLRGERRGSGVGHGSGRDPE